MNLLTPFSVSPEQTPGDSKRQLAGTIIGVACGSHIKIVRHPRQLSGSQVPLRIISSRGNEEAARRSVLRTFHRPPLRVHRGVSAARRR